MAKEFIDSFIEDDVDLIDDGKCDKVVYLHRRADDGLPFYVGIGVPTRPKKITGRNDFWMNVYRKHGRTIELLHTGLSVAEAKRIEIELIAKFRSEYPGIMTNLTDGGDGSTGLLGEEHGQFKGSVIGTSLDNRFFIVLAGARSIEEAGFNPKKVYDCINGHNDQHYGMRWSRSDKLDMTIYEGMVRINHFDDLGINCVRFKGSVVGISLDNRFFIVLAGARSIKEAGFNPKQVYECINGSHEHHRRMRWSRPSAVDRSMFDGMTEIFHASELGIDFNAPEHHQNFLGFSVGISKCRTKFIILAGGKEIIKAGFNHGRVSDCISGRLKSHKKFTWTRSTVLDPDDFHGMTPLDQRSADRLNEFKI